MTEKQKELREVWLSELGLDESDVKKDENHKEYVEMNYEEEGGADNIVKTFLPDDLQRDYVPF